MRNYETIFIANPNVSSEEIESLIKKVETIVQNANGEIVAIERWGLRRLSYIVKKFNRGNYVFFKITADQKVVDELQNFFKLDDSIIKYMTVIEKIHKLKKAKADKKIVKAVKIEVGSDFATHPENELH